MWFTRNNFSKHVFIGEKIMAALEIGNLSKAKWAISHYVGNNLCCALIPISKSLIQGPNSKAEKDYQISFDELLAAMELVVISAQNFSDSEKVIELASRIVKDLKEIQNLKNAEKKYLQLKEIASYSNKAKF